MCKLKCVSLISVLITFVVFTIYSASVDTYMSVLTYDKFTAHFYGEVHLWCTMIYKAIPITVIAIVAVSLLLLIFKKKLPFSIYKTKRFAIVVLLSLIIGPGLVCNSLLKDNWGRPRPYQVIRDKHEFRPFYKPDFGESHYNSFPSGHATIGFFLGVPFLALGRRRKGLVVAVIGGGIVGLVRILQGGHYLSDVIFAGIFVWGVAELVVYLYDKFFKVK